MRVYERTWGRVSGGHLKQYWLLFYSPASVSVRLFSENRSVYLHPELKKWVSVHKNYKRWCLNVEKNNFINLPCTKSRPQRGTALLSHICLKEKFIQKWKLSSFTHSHNRIDHYAIIYTQKYYVFYLNFIYCILYVVNKDKQSVINRLTGNVQLLKKKISWSSSQNWFKWFIHDSSWWSSSSSAHWLWSVSPIAVMKVIQVLTDMRVSKWWQKLHLPPH